MWPTICCPNQGAIHDASSSEVRDFSPVLRGSAVRSSLRCVSSGSCHIGGCPHTRPEPHCVLGRSGCEEISRSGLCFCELFAGSVVAPSVLRVAWAVLQNSPCSIWRGTGEEGSKNVCRRTLNCGVVRPARCARPETNLSQTGANKAVRNLMAARTHAHNSRERQCRRLVLLCQSSEVVVVGPPSRAGTCPQWCKALSMMPARGDADEQREGVSDCPSVADGVQVAPMSCTFDATCFNTFVKLKLHGTIEPRGRQGI